MSDDNTIRITSIRSHIVHQPVSEAYRDGWDRTFGKPANDNGEQITIDEENTCPKPQK